jgi:hypothetical protein
VVRARDGGLGRDPAGGPGAARGFVP